MAHARPKLSQRNLADARHTRVCGLRGELWDVVGVF